VVDGGELVSGRRWRAHGGVEERRWRKRGRKKFGGKMIWERNGHRMIEVVLKIRFVLVFFFFFKKKYIIKR
jgi:hypothetical protein